MDAQKFRDWFKKQDKDVLDEVYMLLQEEYESRGLDIETDRQVYRSSHDSPEQMASAMVKRLSWDDDKRCGGWC